MAQYVYLLQTSRFVVAQEPIYKIGRTEQSNFRRFGNYENGFVMLFQSSCRDCKKLEKQIRILFKSRYVWRSDCGYEYFEGDQFSMIRDLCDIVRNEGVAQDEGVEEPMQDENDEYDTSNDISTVQEDDTESEEEEVSAGSNANEDDDDTVNDGEEVLAGSNATEDQGDNENGVVVLFAGVQRPFNCIPCGLSTFNRSNFAKHRRTQSHIRRTQNPGEYAFRCTICANTYRSRQSLWNHEVRCRAREPIIPTPHEARN